MSAQPVRIILAHPADQAPGDGLAALARALRDAGHEVIHAGAQAPRQLVAAAIQEDADLMLILLGEPTPSYLDEVQEAAAAAAAPDIGVRTVEPGEQLSTLVTWVQGRTDQA